MYVTDAFGDKVQDLADAQAAFDLYESNGRNNGIIARFETAYGNNSLILNKDYCYILVRKVRQSIVWKQRTLGVIPERSLFFKGNNLSGQTKQQRCCSMRYRRYKRLWGELRSFGAIGVNRL